MATQHGLTVAVDTAGWVGLDHDPTSMPMAMMPGAPAEGRGRVAVAVTASNRTSGAQRIGTGELTLVAGGRRSWAPGATTLEGGLVLQPGQQLGITMWFDVDLPADGLQLAWRRAGDTVRFPVLGTEPDPAAHH